jgi:hypothetical protein
MSELKLRPPEQIFKNGVCDRAGRGCLGCKASGAKAPGKAEMPMSELKLRPPDKGSAGARDR